MSSGGKEERFQGASCEYHPNGIIARQKRKLLIKRSGTQMGKVATSMFIIYHVFFGLGYASVPWVYSAEVSSLGWRTRGAAAATSINWLGGFAVVQFTKVGLDNLGWRFFLSKFLSIRLLRNTTREPSVTTMLIFR